jgi:hypothetical protein
VSTAPDGIVKRLRFPSKLRLQLMVSNIFSFLVKALTVMSTHSFPLL